MKLFKHIAISIFLTLGIFCAVLYTSCSKDACKGITCLNGAVCGGGVCGPCKSGISGANCEIVYRTLYAFSYNGVVNIAGHLDSLTAIDSNCAKHELVFTAGTDTVNYNNMTLDWKDSTSRLLLSMPIVLANNSASGSDFTVASVTSDTFTYVGSGNVSTTSASLNLTRTHPHGSSKVLITFTNMSRQ